MRETIIDGQPLFVFEKMESSIEKASGEGARRHSQEDSTSNLMNTTSTVLVNRSI